MSATRVRTRAAAAVGSVVLLASGLLGASASAVPTGSPRTATTPAAAGWTAGGLVSGVSAPRTAAVTASSGGSGIATVGGCVFYATSSSAGGYCPSGGTATGVPESLQHFLHRHGVPFTPCRFFPLPEGMVINHEEPPGGHFMIKACLSHVDLEKPWGGPNVDVVIYVQWVPKDKKQQWVDNVPQPIKDLWGEIGQGNYYPLPRIGSGPASPVRVGSYQYFWTTWVQAIDSSKSAEPNFDFDYNTFTQGTVTLHAELASFVIDPGQDGLPDIPCGKADVPFDPNERDTVPRSEGGSQPSECWTVYQHSSSSEENEVVKLTGKATWHVEVRQGGQQLADLGLHSYTVRQRLAVGEVQPLTDW